MDRFAIVEFTEENAVDVVPESWIEKQDEVILEFDVIRLTPVWMRFYIRLFSF
jgi:hypothetical protein